MDVFIFAFFRLLSHNLSVFRKFDLDFSEQMPSKMCFGREVKLRCLGTCVSKQAEAGEKGQEESRNRVDEVTKQT